MVRLFGGVLLEGKQGSSKKMILFFLCTLLIRNINLYRLWWLEVSMHTHTHTHTHTVFMRFLDPLVLQVDIVQPI